MKHYRDLLNEAPVDDFGEPPMSPSGARVQQRTRMAKADFAAAVRRWEQEIARTKEQIRFLEAQLAEDMKRLATAKKRAAAGDWDGGAQELWKDSFGF